MWVCCGPWQVHSERPYEWWFVGFLNAGLMCSLFCDLQLTRFPPQRPYCIRIFSYTFEEVGGRWGVNKSLSRNIYNPFDFLSILYETVGTRPTKKPSENPIDISEQGGGLDSGSKDCAVHKTEPEPVRLDFHQPDDIFQGSLDRNESSSDRQARWMEKKTYNYHSISYGETFDLRLPLSKEDFFWTKGVTDNLSQMVYN